MVAQNGTHEPDARPSAKALLPFRQLRDSLTGGIILECDCVLQTGEKIPYRLQLGNPDSAMEKLYNPLAVAIFRTMQMFWEQEKRLDQMAAERDQGAATVAERIGQLEKELKEERFRSRELQGRLSKGK